MIAGCIERMRQDRCGGCDKRDACARIGQIFGFDFAAARRRPAAERTSQSPQNPFFAVLGEVAKAIGSRTKAPPSPFRREVERKVEALLASGDVGIDRVARELGYSRQTLYRRLKGDGVTYEQLLDELRRRLAVRMVRDEGLSVKEAAYRLGFSDPAAFSRAFKRWTGSSPGAMRGEH